MSQVIPVTYYSNFLIRVELMSTEFSGHENLQFDIHIVLYDILTGKPFTLVPWFIYLGWNTKTEFSCFKEQIVFYLDFSFHFVKRHHLPVQNREALKRRDIFPIIRKLVREELWEPLHSLYILKATKRWFRMPLKNWSTKRGVLFYFLLAVDPCVECLKIPSCSLSKINISTMLISEMWDKIRWRCQKISES